VLRVLAVSSEEPTGGRIVRPRVETTLGLAIQHARLDGELREIAAFQGAQGLAAIHAQGVFHRDIRKSKALVTFAARGLLLCWAGFGLAHAADGTLRTVDSSRAMGALGYMAPELWHVARPAYRKATDVYAFVLVAAEIFSGRAPVRGVEGEREERFLRDEMRAGGFDVRPLGSRGPPRARRALHAIRWHTSWPSGTSRAATA
jgi:serine/threonine protein kinase